jgi:hypothetical protein
MSPFVASKALPLRVGWGWKIGTDTIFPGYLIGIYGKA